VNLDVDSYGILSTTISAFGTGSNNFIQSIPLTALGTSDIVFRCKFESGNHTYERSFTIKMTTDLNPSFYTNIKRGLINPIPSSVVQNIKISAQSYTQLTESVLTITKDLKEDINISNYIDAQRQRNFEDNLKESFRVLLSPESEFDAKGEIIPNFFKLSEKITTLGTGLATINTTLSSINGTLTLVTTTLTAHGLSITSLRSDVTLTLRNLSDTKERLENLLVEGVKNILEAVELIISLSIEDPKIREAQLSNLQMYIKEVSKEINDTTQYARDISQMMTLLPGFVNDLKHFMIVTEDYNTIMSILKNHEKEVVKLNDLIANFEIDKSLNANQMHDKVMLVLTCLSAIFSGVSTTISIARGGEKHE